MKTNFIASLAILPLLCGMIACQDVQKTTETPMADVAVLDTNQQLMRGQYLVSTMGCDDCHSPKRMGALGPEIIPELRLSGFPQGGQLPPANPDAVKKGWVLFAPDQTATIGPWGISYAANITSDATGIGNWTEKQFVNAIRKGKFKGMDNSRPLLPPMPWTTYRNMTDDDLKAIFAYLKTVKPVRNVAPAPAQLAQLQ